MIDQHGGGAEGDSVSEDAAHVVVVGQALEETTAIVEGAAASLAQTFGRPEAAQQIIEASGVGGDDVMKLLGTGEPNADQD